MLYRILSIIALLIAAYPLHADSGVATASAVVSNHYSDAQLIADRAHVTPGEPLTLALHIDMKDGWHTYWRNPGDSGIPTSLTLALPHGAVAGALQWPAPIRFEMAGIVNYGYKEAVTHAVQVEIPATFDGGQFMVDAKAHWLICEDICVPESAEFTLSLPVRTVPASNDAAFYRLIDDVPQAALNAGVFTVRDGMMTAFVPGVALDSDALLFVSNESAILHEYDAFMHVVDKGTWIQWHAGAITPETLQFVAVEDDVATEFTASYDAALRLPDVNVSPVHAQMADNGLSLWAALWFAFLGGLLLNLMPCVLPVLSLKAMSLVHVAAASRALAVRHGVAYMLGVVTSFVVIAGMLVAIQMSGERLGWGFQLQSPGFVAAMSLLMLLVALNLFGMVELPVLFGTLGQERASRHTPSGSFFTGILAVLVATPCLAPYMAPAIGYALAQPPAVLVAVFVVLGVGLATPFMVISLVPAAARMLPKPGNWMVRFKQFMAFPMLATSAWLLWVLTVQVGAHGLAVMLAVMIVVAWLLWVIMCGASLWLRRGCLIAMVAVMALGVRDVSKAPPMPDDVSLGAQEVMFSAEALQRMRNEGRAVFVYATADWCLICKVNEQTTLQREVVQRYLAEQNVVVMRADWTDYDDDILTFLTSHARSGVPIYVYYAADGEVTLLPQLLTPDIIRNAIP